MVASCVIVLSWKLVFQSDMNGILVLLGQDICDKPDVYQNQIRTFSQVLT